MPESFHRIRTSIPALHVRGIIVSIAAALVHTVVLFVRKTGVPACNRDDYVHERSVRVHSGTARVCTRTILVFGYADLAAVLGRIVRTSCARR